LTSITDGLRMVVEYLLLEVLRATSAANDDPDRPFPASTNRVSVVYSGPSDGPVCHGTDSSLSVLVDVRKSISAFCTNNQTLLFASRLREMEEITEPILS
jgi:hypothetical protein